jgi:hypothetical protein
MQIKVDDVVVLELSAIQLQILQSEINEDLLTADIQRRAAWVISHKLEQTFASLKKEWEPKLIAAGATSLPVSAEDFAAMVFSQPTYQSRKQKDLAVQG